MGLNIDRADMAHWTILCAERYLSVFYDYLHERIYDYHVLQADETPVLVSKENRRREVSITYGCTEPARCIWISRSFCMSTNPLVMQAIQEHF